MFYTRFFNCVEHLLGVMFVIIDEMNGVLLAIVLNYVFDAVIV